MVAPEHLADIAAEQHVGGLEPFLGRLVCLEVRVNLPRNPLDIPDALVRPVELDAVESFGDFDHVGTVGLGHLLDLGIALERVGLRLSRRQ
jgi:hypothetical protein